MRTCSIAIFLVLATSIGAAGNDGIFAEGPPVEGQKPAFLKSQDAPSPTASGGADNAVLPANPLCAVRLSDLPATRDRPIFSPSRRPRAPPPIAVALPPPPKPVAAPREPDHPPLALVGTVVGESLQIAVFREEATREMMRLKTGDDYKGWSLRSVTTREAIFEGPHRNAVLALPPPQATAIADGVPPPESEPPVRHRRR